jgi:hypothetical protein
MTGIYDGGEEWKGLPYDAEKYEAWLSEAWQREPDDWREIVFGPCYWATQGEVQREIGPEYEMWYNWPPA